MNWLSFVKWEMITTAFTLGVASSGCAAVSFAAKPICEHSVFDESAGVNFVAGLPVYISPRKVTKFSGCQTMWDSKGRISMQIFFARGRLFDILSIKMVAQKS